MSQSEDSSDHSQPPGNDMSQSEDSSDSSQPPVDDMSQSEDSSDSSQPPVDDMSRAQSSQSVNQSSNMSKASGSKTPDVTESQRNRRHLKRTNKHREFMDALNGTKKSAEQIKNNKSKGKAPSPTKKRKTPINASWVWRYAEKCDIAGVRKVKCSICGHIIGKLQGSCTSNTIRHLKFNHVDVYNKEKGISPDTEEQVQPKIDTKFESENKIKWKRDSKKSIDYDRKLLRFFVKTSQSFTIVECREFRDITPNQYQPPSRKTFTKVILHNGYNFTLSAVQEQITSNPNMVIGLQVDHTTAGNYAQFGSLCIQFVDADFNLRSVSTGTFPYEGKHTGDALYDSCEGAKGLVKEWKMDRFTRVYTTDSYTGNKKGFGNKPNIYWVPCLAHQFHNTVKAGLDKCVPVNLLHSKMKRILEFCHKSPLHLRLIKGNAKWLGVPELTVLSECPTRWNSFMLCCERFILIKEPLNVTLHDADKKELILTPGDILLMKEIVEELQTFRDLTVRLSSNTHFTFNEYLPMVAGIKRQLSRELNPAFTTSIMTDFIKQMKIHFDNFELQPKVKKLAWTACLLDPININMFNPTDVPNLVTNVVELIALFATTPPESQDTVEPSQPPVNVTVNIPKSDKSKKNVSGLSKYFDPQQGWAQPQMAAEVVRPNSKSVKDTVVLEVNNLRTQFQATSNELFVKLREGSYDCATWWKTNHKQYPTLASVVKNLFCIPATSANCERAFSTLTDVVTKKRNRLHAETTRKLTFLKHNLQYMPQYTTYSEEEETETQTGNDKEFEEYEMDQWDE